MAASGDGVGAFDLLAMRFGYLVFEENIMNEIVKNDCQLDDPELWQIAAMGWGRVGKPSREAWEASAQAVSQKVREETIEECCRLLVTKADDHAHVAKSFSLGKQEIIMAKGQAFAEAVTALVSLLKEGKANDSD